jgi:N-acetylneuraminate synthase
MKVTVEFGSRRISSGDKPYVIAEIGVNHEGSLDQAKQLIEQAKAGGADAAKFQSYKAGLLASRKSPSYWDVTKESTRSQYELFKKFDGFEPQDYEELALHCKKVDLDFMSTPFDDSAIEFLDPLVSVFKVASSDITNFPLLKLVAGKAKPVLLSTGASNMDEIDHAINILMENGCTTVIPMHCILNYPTTPKNTSLRMIKGLRTAYPRNLVGYSDHSVPDQTLTPLMVAWLLGATVLEKHFTGDKTLSGNDHYHSMDQHDLSKFIQTVDKLDVLLGKNRNKETIASEDVARKNARRSIVTAHRIDAGHKLSAKDLIPKRPAIGISPTFWDQVVGRVAARNLEPDHILQWSDLL